jgi:hypothetical protein
LFSGQPADPRSSDFIRRNSGNVEQIEVGWWPGDARYPRPAFFSFAFPVAEGLGEATLSAPGARWDAALGEYILDWDDARAAPDPRAAALDFGLSTIRHSCAVCDWDPVLAASAEGTPPPVS